MTRTAYCHERAEQYLFDGLTEAEHSLFEEHMFGCSVCAEEARLAAIFTATVRAVFLQGFGRSSVQLGWSDSGCLRPALADQAATALSG